MDSWDKSQKLPIIIWDNASIHCSDCSERVISNLEPEVRPLPPYCPEVTPIEHIFRAIKAKLRSRSSIQTIDFGNTSGIEKIRDCLVDISKQTLMSVWTEVILEWSVGITSTLRELSKKENK